ncbi:hypothetical protein FYJ34_07780 [Clostridiaceae bacterium 68-1-5]|uniref:Uncharacterized protein n=1 Tax=Suipraeoptans intestinalis TaxID=2606628 RepID=A0A6N7UT21_9FIRM|nr:hypothetical protein [Suipraeoptans intestinalis]MSR94158.1 hypothetical protein [Suipraeoptans intestinalis]
MIYIQENGCSHRLRTAVSHEWNAGVGGRSGQTCSCVYHIPFQNQGEARERKKKEKNKFHEKKNKKQNAQKYKNKTIQNIQFTHAHKK